MGADVTFHGIDVSWMQAQWRDCADKAEQLKIFRDIFGKKVTVQEILDAVGDPTYCGPMDPPKRVYRRYTAEDDALIIRMAAEGRTNAEIGEALGVAESAIFTRITRMRKRGVEIPERKRGGAPKPKAGPAEEPVPVEIVGEPDPEGVPVPSEVSFTGLGQAREELDRLLAEEDSLRVRLQEVTAQIGAFRKALSELLSMAGGGLDHAEP
jgi:hypothetical protein